MLQRRDNLPVGIPIDRDIHHAGLDRRAMLIEHLVPEWGFDRRAFSSADATPELFRTLEE